MALSHIDLDAPGTPPGRNDPCPCGSEKKTKRCCAVDRLRFVPLRGLATRIATVTGFLKTLTGAIEFGSNADAEAVLDEMKRMPALLRSRKLTSADVDGSLIHGSWKRLVFGAPPDADGTVDRNAYVFCVLTQFHRYLKRREIYANASSRWRDPRAQLLAGDAWKNAKDSVLTALSLPATPDDLLAGHAQTATPPTAASASAWRRTRPSASTLRGSYTSSASKRSTSRRA